MSIQPKVPPTLSIPAVLLLFIVLCFTVSAHSQASSASHVPIDPLLAAPLTEYNQATLSVQELGSAIQVEQVFPNATSTRTPTPINIGNFVWDDFDQDGRQDAGEPGMAGITVQLWNSTKTALLDSAVTNASGNYTVTAPVPGNYRVRVILPSSADQFTVPNAAGGNDELDSDINPSGANFGFTGVFNLATNVISTTIYDAGIIRFRTPTPTRTPTPINIGNFVWNDTSGDGVQNGGEVGLVGITVQLWNSSKTSLIAQTVTGSSGQYAVVAPIPGNYRVRVIPPSGALFTLKDQGNDLFDSDINTSGADTGFTDIISIASNVISITSIDAGLVNVPATPTPTLTFTPSGLTPPASVTPSATSSTANTYDTLAMYSKKLNIFSLVDTLETIPAPGNFQLFTSSSPEKGKFVMGDWDGDGQKTPGLFKAQSFWITNQLGAAGAWSEVQIGDFGKIVVIAGRFDAAVPNDCIGVVQLENVAGHRFALHYTCELTVQNPPSGIMTQWIDIELNGVENYQFIAGDWNGDGLDSIAIRRDKKIKWGDTVPSQGVATFTGTQKFKTPNESYGAIVSGDWNGDGIDTFGIYSKGDGLFFYRNDLDKAKLSPSAQNLGLSIGKAFAASWRKTSSAAPIDTLLLLPEAPPMVNTPAP